MIRRIYVDNLGCLVNLELQLDRMQLLLGPNGSGKSTVLEALRRTQTLLARIIRERSKGSALCRTS